MPALIDGIPLLSSSCAFVTMSAHSGAQHKHSTAHHSTPQCSTQWAAEFDIHHCACVALLCCCSVPSAPSTVVLLVVSYAFGDA